MGAIDERLRVGNFQETAGSAVSIRTMVERGCSSVDGIWISRLAGERKGWSGETRELHSRDGSEAQEEGGRVQRDVHVFLQVGVVKVGIEK